MEPPTTSPMTDDARNAQVRERLLEAGERLFGLKGFAETSVRDITAEAGCNVAAVNYYFSSKEHLYQAIFDLHLARLREYRVTRIRQLIDRTGARPTLDELMRVFVTAFLEPCLAQGAGQTLLMLMMREMISPRLEPGTIVRQLIDPVRQVMAEAISIVCPKLGRETALACIDSTVSQLVGLVQMPLLGMGTRLDQMDPAELNRNVEHVVRFSTAAIRGIEKGGGHA